MRSSLECLPCFLRQSLEAAKQATDDPACYERVVHRVCEVCQRFDFDSSPPVMGQTIHRIIREVSGNDDPYRTIKDRFNRHGVLLRDRFRRRVMDAEDPFETALRLAIAGNRIDFGAQSGITEQEVSELVEQAFSQPLNGRVAALRRAVEESETILFLADNTGEIALDALLIEQMPREKITVAVRGRPVLNDATLDDAKAVRLHQLVRVIDNGSDAPGTVLDDCSASFRRAFEQADLVIAKGQGNYESLSDVKHDNLYFLLIPKCELVANHLGCPQGSFVVRPAKEIQP